MGAQRQSCPENGDKQEVAQVGAPNLGVSPRPGGQGGSGLTITCTGCDDPGGYIYDSGCACYVVGAAGTMTVTMSPIGASLGPVVLDAANNGMLFAGANLPPGMNGPAQYFKWATRGKPPITPPPSTRPVPDPNQVPPGVKPDPWRARAIDLIFGNLTDVEFFVPIVIVSPCQYDPMCGQRGPNP